ncbi:MAG: sodium-dependent transporter [Lachnospiraceae bacterium]|nr:sodium-dependent transporter [Lachnospiraceae bacterium]
MEREKFQSRLGFILISAGCAIGIGNVWKFPYVTGQNGGGIFVLIYLLFLVIIGVPIMSMEFAVGRATRLSGVQAFKTLEKAGQKWHLNGYMGMIGNYTLMMFYTTVAGWMLYYCYMFITGKFYSGMDTTAVSDTFFGMLGEPYIMAFWMLVVVLLGFMVCSLGLRNGVERITKWMMLTLLILISILAIHCLRQDGAMEGLKFFLVPDWSKVQEIGLANVVLAAMNQSFFTLSIGIGAMQIFGSYLGREHSLVGESIQIAALDTLVAVMSGLIIFPACFSFGVEPGSGPGLVFVTLPNIFNNMSGGRIWGALFFVFLFFAALSTVIAVFENIMAMSMDNFGIGRKKAAVINFLIIAVCSLPCVLGFNLWSGFMPFGEGSNIMDLEDFIVSNLMLPGGSLCYLIFCVHKKGWGFKNWLQEANTGEGVKMPAWVRLWVSVFLPCIVLFLLLYGIWSKFFG